MKSLFFAVLRSRHRSVNHTVVVRTNRRNNRPFGSRHRPRTGNITRWPHPAVHVTRVCALRRASSNGRRVRAWGGRRRGRERGENYYTYATHKRLTKTVREIPRERRRGVCASVSYVVTTSPPSSIGTVLNILYARCVRPCGVCDRGRVRADSRIMAWRFRRGARPSWTSRIPAKRTRRTSPRAVDPSPPPLPVLFVCWFFLFIYLFSILKIFTTDMC